jgi:HAD superfamily hydrolase (TIGR01509 family)
MGLNVGKITHLFIDLDGTLVNSLPLLRSVYEDFLNEQGMIGSKKEFSQLKTSSIEKIIEYFKMKYTLHPPSLMLKKQYEMYLEKHYFKAPLFHGVKTFLHKAQKNDLKIILTTASQKEFAQKVLKLHQIDSFFSEVITPSCLGHQKKDMGYYQDLLKRLQLQATSPLVIDDSLEVIASVTQMGLKAFLFSKINYHPLPCFGSWRILTREWFTYAQRTPLHLSRD